MGRRDLVRPGRDNLPFAVPLRARVGDNPRVHTSLEASVEVYGLTDRERHAVTVALREWRVDFGSTAVHWSDNDPGGPGLVMVSGGDPRGLMKMAAPNAPLGRLYFRGGGEVRAGLG